MFRMFRFVVLLFLSANRMMLPTLIHGGDVQSFGDSKSNLRLLKFNLL